MKDTLPPPLGNIEIDKEDVPPDCVMITGKNLMMVAKRLGISFGRAWHRGKNFTRISDGIIIRKTDQQKWEDYQNR